MYQDYRDNLGLVKISKRAIYSVGIHMGRYEIREFLYNYIRSEGLVNVISFEELTNEFVVIGEINPCFL